MEDRIAYKVLTSAEFAQLQQEHVFRGSAVDLADGFIHLSKAEQVTETVDKHFHGQTGLMIAAVDLSQLGDTVRWETSRGGALFPHIYAALPMTAVTATCTLERRDDGSVKLPA